MSPYQQQVIDATMTSFDKQAAQRRRGISDQALQAGAYGGSRMGVATIRIRRSFRHESSSHGITNVTTRLRPRLMAGSTNSFWTTTDGTLAQTVPGMYQSRYCDFGSQWAQHNKPKRKQTEDAKREGLRMEAFEPYERLGFLGQGLDRNHGRLW